MKLFTGSVLLIGLFSSCAAGRISQSFSATENYCEPATAAGGENLFRPLPTLPADAQLDRHLSPRELLMANATGILPLLQELIQLPQTDNLGRASRYQQIQSRLLLASTEIASLAAELDCEGERADQLATYLDQRDRRRVRNLTLLSVVVGALTTVATTLIQADTKVVGLGGGLIGAGLGGAAAFSSNQSVEFLHRRNLLADIWSESEQTTVYSPFIWYVLNEKQFSNSGQASVRHNIRLRWQRYVLAQASPDQQQLYFGAGGPYQADDLHIRSNMLDQLQASVRSINQDLQGLMTRLAR